LFWCMALVGATNGWCQPANADLMWSIEQPNRQNRYVKVQTVGQSVLVSFFRREGEGLVFPLAGGVAPGQTFHLSGGSMTYSGTMTRIAVSGGVGYRFQISINIASQGQTALGTMDFTVSWKGGKCSLDVHSDTVQALTPKAGPRQAFVVSFPICV